MANVQLNFISQGVQFNLTISFAGAATTGTATGISGTVGGETITGLSNYASGDNVVSSVAPYVSIDGLSWTTNVGSYNIYDNGGVFVVYAPPLGYSNTATSNVSYAAANTPPDVGNLGGDIVAFDEGSTPVRLDNATNATVTDPDSADFNGGTLTVSIVANEDATDDVLGINSANGVTIAGNAVSVSGIQVGTITSNGSGGADLVIALNANATAARMQTLIRELNYSNTDTVQPSTASRTVRVTLNDGDGGTSTADDVTVQVNGVNDAPTLSATGATPTFTEGGSAVDLFSGVSISTIETGQSVNQLTLSVTNVANGASEVLSIDGSSVALTNGNSVTTATNGMTVSVSVSGSTATVTISKVGGVSAATAQTVVDGMTYSNSSEAPGAGSRVVTLTSITDSGGTSNSGIDTTTTSIAATVTVNAVNDAPVVANINGDIRNWTEVTGANVGLDQSGNGTVTDPDSADFDNGIITVSLGVTGLAEDQLVVANVGPVVFGGGFVFHNGDIVGSATGGTNGSNLVITLTSQNTPATPTVVQDILHALQYGNTGGDTPTAGGRTVTISLTDGDGGTSNTSTVTVNVIAVDDPAVAVNDAFTLLETGTIIAGNLLTANPTTPDSDPDGPTPTVGAVNGDTNDVGVQVTLASGALLAVYADGTFDYNPNGAFDDLPDFFASGASNITGTDTFTYTLDGGGTATVTITVQGVDSDDAVDGTPGLDSLNGGIGNDIITGLSGADTLTGGTGDDTYVNPLGDTIVEAAGAGGGTHDTILSALSYNLNAAPNVEDITLSGGGNFNAMGNNFANVLTGNSGNNQINAGGGADRLIGGAGNDTMNGGNGADVFVFATSNTGIDRITGFSVTQDRFNLSGGTFTDLQYYGADTVLTHAGGKIRIEGINTLNLAQWRALVDNNARIAPQSEDHAFTGRLTGPDPDPVGHFAAHADFLFA